MARRVIRLISLLVIACALLWVADVWPAAVRDDVVLGLGRRILHEETLPMQARGRLQQRVDEVEAQLDCRVATRRAVAMFRLRIAEETATDAALNDFRDSARHLLECSPHEPLFWFALFWFDATRTGLTPSSYALLRMSYELGPHEGWLMHKRSRLMLPLLNVLPQDLRPLVVEEFLTMLAGGQVNDAVEAFRNSDSTVRELVLPSLVKLPERRLAAFSRSLRNAGIEARIPGLREREQRPWQR